MKMSKAIEFELMRSHQFVGYALDALDNAAQVNEQDGLHVDIAEHVEELQRLAQKLRLKFEVSS